MFSPSLSVAFAIVLKSSFDFDSDFWRGGEALEEEEVCNEQKFSAEIAERRLDEESGC